MATLHGIDGSTSYPQANSSLSRDREGKWTASRSFVCRKENAINLIPQPGATHPDFDFLGLETVSVQVSEGGLAEVTCSYAGTDEGGDDLATYSLSVTLSEEPLLSHPAYDSIEDEAEREALRAIASGKEKDDSGVSYKDLVTSDTGLVFLERLLRGQDSYLVPRLNWKQSYVTKTKPSGTDVLEIGKVSNPPGDAPSLQGNANWLLNSVSASVEGTVWSIEKEWIASDAEGWDPVLYGQN